MCGSALFEPCGAAFCRVAPLQSSDSSSPSRFFSEYFPPAETGAVSCFSFSVQAAAGAIAARAHGLEAVLGGPRRRPGQDLVRFLVDQLPPLPRIRGERQPVSVVRREVHDREVHLRRRRRYVWHMATNGVYGAWHRLPY